MHVSGCPRACASHHLLTIQRSNDGGGARRHTATEPAVVIAGELVDGVPTPAADLAPTVTRKLKE